MLGGSTISAANALQSMNSASLSSSSTAMAVSTSYNSDRASITTGLDVEFASDAASGSFFNTDYKKCVCDKFKFGFYSIFYAFQLF